MRDNPTGVPFPGWQSSRDSGAEPGDRVGKGVPSKGDSTHSPNWRGFQRQGLEISCLQLLPCFWFLCLFFFPFNNPTLGTSSLIIKFPVD